MDLIEAENIFSRVIEEEVALSENPTLLKKFITSWMEMVFKEGESVSVFFNWYKKMFLNQENRKSNSNSCTLAIIILEKLLEANYFDLTTYSNDVFSQIILPLHKIITCYQISENNASNNIEMILSFYKIHLKLSENDHYAKQIKKYGLWKEMLRIYLKNNKFNLLIQNMCTEYLNNLLSTECMPDELFLLLDIVTANSKIIKVNIEACSYNDQILFLSFRLVNYVFVKTFPQLNREAFGLLSRKFSSLCDTSLKIAFESKNTSVIKYALFVHILLKYCFIATNESVDSQFFFENLIHSIGNTLIDSKFFKYIPEVFCLFAEIFFDLIFENSWINVQVITCNVYFRRHCFDVNIPPHEVKQSSEIIHFLEKYHTQLLKSLDLPNIVDSILKLTHYSYSRVSEDGKNYLISSMNSLLKSFVLCDDRLSPDLCNLLMNTINAVNALLTKDVVPPKNFDAILATSVGIYKLDLQNRMDIKIAAYNLCKTILKQKKEVSTLELEPLKQLIIDSIRDDRWEVRDCVLELLVDLITMYSKVNGSCAMDQEFFEIFSKTLSDDESYVRASAYNVLSELTLLPADQSVIDYELLLSQTTVQFSKETECNVRVNMIMFIECVWQNRKIMNNSLLIDIYETMYRASSIDLYEEVRVRGMLFWQQLIQNSLASVSTEVDDEFFELLASIGCLQAIVNALEDEYDLQVTRIGLNILNLLLSSIEEANKDCAQPDHCQREGLRNPITLPMNEQNIIIFKHSLNIISQVERSRKFIRGKDFLNKFNKINFEEMKNEKLGSKEVLNLKNLIYSFKEVTFDADINEKDCY